MIFYCILKSDSRGFPVSLVLHSFCCLAVSDQATIPAKSLWPPSEENPPPLPLFQCCYNDVDFSFDIFLNLQNNIGQGVWGKSKPLYNVIV